MDYFSRHIKNLQSGGLLRTLRPVSSPPGPVVACGGRELILLSSNDYLGLAGHPRVIKSLNKAARLYGTGSGASRLISGTSILHTELEKKTARFKGTEACLVFNSGYQANCGIIPAIAPEGSVIFSDELNHASLIDGMRLSKAEVRIYPHRDASALRTMIAGYKNIPGMKWIITDSIFSMDGDTAPLREITDIAAENDAFLMIDEAHATGVRGPGGRGLAHETGTAGGVTLHMGTFSKALGTFGAYAAGAEEMITYLMNTVRSYIFSTALPPAVAAASITSLDIAEKGDALRDALRRNAEKLGNGLKEQGWNVPPAPSHIIPVITGEPEITMKISDRLFELGIWAHGIRPPTVPRGTSRLRLTPTAAHTDTHIIKALAAFETVYGEYSAYLPRKNTQTGSVNP